MADIVASLSLLKGMSPQELRRQLLATNEQHRQRYIAGSNRYTANGAHPEQRNTAGQRRARRAQR